MTTSTAPLERLTGWQGDPGYFRFEERTSLTDLSPVLQVLRGKLLGVVYRGVIDPAAAREIVRRFWESPARKRRGGEVCESLGYYVGAYHYHKPTQQYIDESAAVAAHLGELLDMPDEPMRVFRGLLGERLAAEGVEFRPARSGGGSACPVLIRHWNADGEFALQPHEDASQCRWPEQAGFEVQAALGYTIAAVNMCLENGDGGRLVIWNMVPSDESKSRIGMYYAGSPYPAGVLEGIEELRLRVEPGDIYVFNGEHVHGVEASAPGAKRTTMAWNMGMCDEGTVVTWT
jgi:hypothetical protein